MKQTFELHQTEDRRLVLLRVLADSTGYQANEFLLESMLDSVGHSVSNDRLHSDLAWLAEQQLITQQPLAGVTIARLTTRGYDVARGRAHAPGVKRPRPE